MMSNHAQLGKIGYSVRQRFYAPDAWYRKRRNASKILGDGMRDFEPTFGTRGEVGQRNINPALPTLFDVTMVLTHGAPRFLRGR
jgi:hypothetical protein